MEPAFCFDVLQPIACGSNALPDGQFHSRASLRKMSSLVERFVSQPHHRAGPLREVWASAFCWTDRAIRSVPIRTDLP